MVNTNGNTKAEHSNRLVQEKSLYLLQHADNPVDWFPWGDEAFERARSEDKPVFLSIGYSTCHWCHVMERESFNRQEVAKLLNDNFVCVKVDREERPDVDELYMNATQLLTGRSGWPNSLWLTPDGRPWFAGTYFPREDRVGQPGFKTLLRGLAEVWHTRRNDVEIQAEQVSQAIKQLSTAGAFEQAGELSRDVIDNALEELRESFDERNGGFGVAPKFPTHASLKLLFYEYRRTGDNALLEMITKTLDAMARGGIYDQIGGGFHRYATDAKWLLPHFEKMLYDNAQLAQAYADGWALTGNDFYRKIAEETIAWVMREMTDETGAFYSAIDAESEGEEGKFYLWTTDEIFDSLDKYDAELFCRAYGVEKEGNYKDESSSRKTGKNVLHLVKPVAELAAEFEIPEGELNLRLDSSRKKLLDVRNQRQRPLTDDKALTAWNGLMIASFAYTGRLTNQPQYTDAAVKAARFALDSLKEDQRLMRTWSRGQARIDAYLEDYAFLAHGLLELHQATSDTVWKDEAEALIRPMIEHFHDDENGGFFLTADDHEVLMARLRDPVDKAVPSGNGIAAQVLVQMADLTGNDYYSELAQQTLNSFSSFLEQAPQATASLLLAAAMHFDAAPYWGTAEPIVPISPQADVRSTQGPITCELFSSKLRAAPGQSLDVILKLSIAEEWHVNSHKPIQPETAPFSFRLKDNLYVELRKVHYPDGKNTRLPQSVEPLSVYDDTVWILAEAQVMQEAQPGDVTLEFVADAQPCNDTACGLPAAIEMSLPLTIQHQAEEEQRHPEVFDKVHAEAAT